jgi:hypothetical protein
MRMGSRRKLDMAILAGGGLFVAGASAIGAAAGDIERIPSLWVGAALHQDGSSAVTEIIDWDFGNAQGKHGIFRDVEGLSPSARIEVTSPDAPDDLAVMSAPVDSPSYPATRLRIGDPNTTVSGRHRYEISYDHDGLQTGGALDWDAIGAAWPVSIEHAEIDIVAPWEFGALSCVRGTTGSTTSCDIAQVEPGRLVVTPGSLDAGEGVTITAMQGAPLAAAPALDVPTGQGPADNGSGIAMPAVIGGAVALLGAAPASFLVRRKGRERVGVGGAADAAWADGTTERRVDSNELASLATIEFAPPRELTPPQGGIVLAETVRPEHKVAWLIDEAIDGSIDVENGPPVTLRRLEFGQPPSVPVLDAIFNGRDEVTLGRYDPSFAAGWSLLGGGLQNWADSSGLWDPAGDRRRLKVRVLGIVGAVLGLVAAGGFAAIAATKGSGWLVGVAVGAAVAGIGLAAAVRAWELRVRTPMGSGLWLRVESFRRFLASSEAYHAEQAAARGVLREYTAWAVAVGEIDRWTHAMQAATNIPDQSALTFAYLAPVLYSASVSASTAPSSSGGGGGGGGGVGGGGGGGGGGSW